MKIWIDFINSPQVSFFDPFVKKLKEDGYEFIITCRDSANTVQLIQQRGWDFTIIGDRVEKTFFRKLFAFPLRIIKLFNFLKKKQPDIGIGQSSFYLPITARLLGIPSIYTNDNEHALGNIPSFIFATKVFLPENLDLAKAQKQGARKHKIIQYPGIKEGVYLWEKGVKIFEERKKTEQDIIYIRPEPSSAQYYKGKLNFLDEFIKSLKSSYPIVILCRDKDQIAHYGKPEFQGILVPEKPIPFFQIASNCKVFIGAGGSMTREMAIMGIPTISVYQGELLDVDKFLINNQYMVHEPELTFSFFENFINEKINSLDSKKNNILIEKGEEAFNLFKYSLLSHDGNKKFTN
ncbi:MAG: DUF354 domain-containing protein [Cecembia sp.]